MAVVVHNAERTAGRYTVMLASFVALIGRKWKLVNLLVQPLPWENLGRRFSKSILGGLA